MASPVAGNKTLHTPEDPVSTDSVAAAAEQGCLYRTKTDKLIFGNCLTSRREAQGSTLAYAGADSEYGASSAVDSGRLFAVLVGKGVGGGSEVIAAATRAAVAGAAELQ